MEMKIIRDGSTVAAHCRFRTERAGQNLSQGVKAGLLDCLMELEKQVTVQEKVVCIVHGGTIMALFDSYGQGSYFDYQCKGADRDMNVRCPMVDANGVVKETSISMRDEKIIFGE